MGLEAVCRVTLNRETSEGRAHCGDGEIDFRGEFRFKWLWKDLTSAQATGGVLHVVRGPDLAEFHLGGKAQKWLEAIQNPKSRLNKLGLKPGHRYAIWGEVDDDFLIEATERAGPPTDGDDLDAIFVRFDDSSELQRLNEARSAIKPDGMIWVVWPKGKKAFREDDARNYGAQIGLVDVKVASFSNELSALKLVIPVALRPKK